VRLSPCYDALEHHGERLTSVDRRLGFPFENGADLVPNNLPLGTLALQVEIVQHPFELINQFGMALKPCIGATLIEKGFDLVHRGRVPLRCQTMVGLPETLAFGPRLRPMRRVGACGKVADASASSGQPM